MFLERNKKKKPRINDFLSFDDLFRYFVVICFCDGFNGFKRIISVL